MYISNDDKQFCSMLDDGIELCYTRQKPYFFSFMSERKQYIATQHLKESGFNNYAFFGGYDGCERKILGLFYDEPDNSLFPLLAIEFSYRKCDVLSHRDFLGALMSLGIERETVGDILVDNGRCVVFVKSELINYITTQIYKIGNVGVKIRTADLTRLPQGKGKAEQTYIVSSLRLDNIVAAVCRLSREKTRSVILSGSVCVNYIEQKNVSYNLKPDDVFSIRGKGKFILNGILSTTGKGRIRISVLYYR